MSLSSWFNHVIYVASAVGRDQYGKTVYGPAREVRARVEAGRREVRRQEADEAIASHILYTDVEVALTDRVWLPGKNPSLPAESNVPLSIISTPDKLARRTLWKVAL